MSDRLYKSPMSPDRFPPQSPIGMFDSGVGGLTVMKEIMHLLPGEDIVYFGDTARLPYGNKSSEAILNFSLENTRFLMSHRIKILVIACNTASAYAFEKLQETLPIPVVGVIEPGAQKAVELTTRGRVAVLGTRATIRSERYQKAILSRNSKIHLVSIPCPLFVPLVEEKFTDHLSAKLVVQEYLKEVRAHQVDTVLLGCTHYPLLKKLIAEELGPEVTILDSARACAEQVASLLHTQGILSAADKGAYRFFVSDSPSEFRTTGEDLMGISMPHVECILP